MATLGERLGYAPDAKLLIVTCHDLGLTHASNVATYDAVRNGLATSASFRPDPIGYGCYAAVKEAIQRGRPLIAGFDKIAETRPVGGVPR